MKQQEIEKKAKEKVEAKKGFYVLAFIFGATAVILLVINLIIFFQNRTFEPDVHVWLLFPILVLALVLTGIYFSVFGIPGTKVLSETWEEEELNREIDRLYRKKGIQLPPDTPLSDEERLELKELERLQEKWQGRDDLV